MVWYEFIKELTTTFWGDFGYSSLFVVALLAILIFEKVKIRRYTYLWYTGLVLFVIYNPLTLIVCRRILEASTFDQYYQRFYSLAPILFVIAYGLTCLLDRLSGVKKLVGVFAAIAIVTVAGHFLYNEDWFTRAENRMKVPQDVVTIKDIFAQDTSEKITIMAPLDLAVYMRQIEPRFSMPYSRYMDKEGYELTNENPDVEMVVDYCDDKAIDYVVVSQAVVNEYLNFGFELMGWTNEYAVLSVCPKPTWILTEYPDASGDQCVCYTMKNVAEGTFIIIDGGDAENADTVRQAIKQNGNHVDAWILTHYHQDHITAFNEVYADLDGITIDEIYVTPLDPEYFYGVAQEWDDVDTFDRFLELTADADNINYVKRDDVLTFSNDLTITFFNACDDVVYNIREDVPNNDSLVFKMETPNRSILICSDAHSTAMAEYLVKQYGDKLKSDILQCGHHGNNSMPVETGFYETVSPSVAIFDCPDWVLYGEKYSAKDLKAYLENNGVRTVSFETAPNVFGF